MSEKITLTMPPKAGQSAHIVLQQHTNGRWMWGLDYTDRSKGCGSAFAPLPKWGHFADSQQAATEAAAEMLRQRIPAHAGEHIRAWLDTVVAPVQRDLFEGASNG